MSKAPRSLPLHEHPAVAAVLIGVVVVVVIIALTYYRPHTIVKEITIPPTGTVQLAHKCNGREEKLDLAIESSNEEAVVLRGNSKLLKDNDELVLMDRACNKHYRIGRIRIQPNGDPSDPLRSSVTLQIYRSFLSR